MVSLEYYVCCRTLLSLHNNKKQFKFPIPWVSALYIDIDGIRGIVQQHVVYKSSNGMNYVINVTQKGMNYVLNFGILIETQVSDHLVAIFSNAGALVVVQTRGIARPVPLFAQKPLKL